MFCVCFQSLRVVDVVCIVILLASTICCFCFWWIGMVFVFIVLFMFSFVVVFCDMVDFMLLSWTLFCFCGCVCCFLFVESRISWLLWLLWVRMLLICLYDVLFVLDYHNVASVLYCLFFWLTIFTCLIIIMYCVWFVCLNW